MSKNLYLIVLICVALYFKPTISQVQSDVVVGSPALPTPAASQNNSQGTPGTQGNYTVTGNYSNVNETPAPGNGSANVTLTTGNESANVTLTTVNGTTGNTVPYYEYQAPSNGSVAQSNDTAASSNDTVNRAHNYYTRSQGSQDYHASSSSSNNSGSTALPTVLTTLTVINGTRIPETIKKIIKKLPEIIELLRELYHYFIVESNL